MTAARVGTLRRGRASPYVMLLIGVWTAVMAARLYPQFDTATRGGRVTTVDNYVTTRCGARLGPVAQACLPTARRNARIQLRRERGKSVLIVVAPAVLYLAYLALAAATESRPRHAESPTKAIT